LSKIIGHLGDEEYFNYIGIEKEINFSLIAPLEYNDKYDKRQSE